MTLAEIMQKIEELSAEERAILRRELEATLCKPETQDVTPETAQALRKERLASNDERGLPVEDVIDPPKRPPWPNKKLDPPGGDDIVSNST